MNFIAQCLAFLIRPLYHFIGNYGWTLIVFTVLIKLLTLPLGIKAQKSTAKIQQIQPLVEEINRKYKNDKQKASEELSKLYQKHGANPMGGCLPMIVQLVVLLGLIRVIYQPFTYILQLTPDELTSLSSLFPDISKYTGRTAEMYLMKYATDPLFLEKLKSFGKGSINLNFMGINLGLTPVLKQIDVLWIIPILATVATALSGWINKLLMPQSDNNQANQMGNSMIYTMPIITLIFAFQMPGAAALYWFVSTVVQTLQQYVIVKFIVKPLPKIVARKKKKTVKPVIETTANDLDEKGEE